MCTQALSSLATFCRAFIARLNMSEILFKVLMCEEIEAIDDVLVFFNSRSIFSYIYALFPLFQKGWSRDSRKQDEEKRMAQNAEIEELKSEIEKLKGSETKLEEKLKIANDDIKVRCFLTRDYARREKERESLCMRVCERARERREKKREIGERRRERR